MERLLNPKETSVVTSDLYGTFIKMYTSCTKLMIPFSATSVESPVL